uniref:Phospholipid/glycerol acyltransferase domain-containing protein n=1 Tax=Chromera velia CCMP2878 TaxID=1169474 RepID=A0A0G4HUM9_9ALVE|eukprot:Cvel_8673.t1-p1 / transcript=Cvel_8673.t1 / gene=Cvel_8673 / organism=Chromera_velia_CCMP2878 / gene_product=hypothetical protein / transcript_product=hypothetical protein / location=Cvel_scaffold484:8574-12165(-) / protein_length=346 / sequence_SO=supercontig / SO=protein_coding / is_pseudo=false
MLARWAVALAFPLTWLMTRRTNTVWFFNRNAARGREGADRFSAWLDSQFDREKNIRTGLLGYPEGTRSHCKASLKQPIRLKKGLLQYAYSRGIPVQVIYTDGQLQVLDERTNFAARPVGTVSSSSRLFERKEKGGPEVKFYREPPILPKDFSDFDGFFSEICHDFEHSRAHVLGHPVEETAKFQKRKREWEMECLEELKERERQTTIKDPSDTFLVDTHRNAVTIHRVTKVASMQTSASVSGMSDKGTSDPSFPLPSPALSLAEESSKRGRGSEETYYHEEDAAGNAVVVPPFGPHFDDDASMHPGEACAFGSDVCVSHLLPCATERRRKGSTSSHVSARDSSSKP